MAIYDPAMDDLMDDYRNQERFTRHGGAYDRGAADKYYGRGFDPHYYKGASFDSERVSSDDMTEDELEAYRAGFDEETSTKDWG